MSKDQAIHWFITCAFLGVSALGIYLSWPLYKGQVPPNSTTGFRTETTLADPTLWYSVNSKVALLLIIANCVLIVLTVLAHFYLTARKPSLAALGLATLMAMMHSAAALYGWSLSK